MIQTLSMMLSKLVLVLAAGLGFVVSTDARQCRTRDTNFDFVRTLAAAIHYDSMLMLVFRSLLEVAQLVFP